jgi:hypothetical protein
MKAPAMWWFILQMLVVFAVMAANIHWQIFPNDANGAYVATGCGLVAAMFVTWVLFNVRSWISSLLAPLSRTDRQSQELDGQQNKDWPDLRPALPDLENPALVARAPVVILRYFPPW